MRRVIQTSPVGSQRGFWIAIATIKLWAQRASMVCAELADGKLLRTCVHILKNARPECTGICRIPLGLAKRAASLEYEISVLFLEEGPLLKKVQDQGVSASTVSWTCNFSDPSGVWRFWSWLRKHRVDIVHLHHGGRAARLISRMAGVGAVVSHVHSRADEPSGDLAETIDTRWADAVVACSQAIAGRVNTSSAEVIYTGIETDPVPPAPSLSALPLRLGVLGRLAPVKNVEAAIIAVSNLAKLGVPVELEIAGTGPLESSLRYLAVHLGIGPRVRFLGWCENSRGLLASWDLLLMPSLDEGFPQAALEAMAAARPVVASRVGGLCELVVDGTTGRLIPVGDTDALTQCIAQLASDRQELALLGVEGWKRARTCFSLDLMTQRMVQLYDQLPNRH